MGVEYGFMKKNFLVMRKNSSIITRTETTDSEGVIFSRYNYFLIN